MPPKKSVQVEGAAATIDAAAVTAGEAVTTAADAEQSPGVVIGQQDKTDGPIGAGEQLGPFSSAGDAELPVLAAPAVLGYIVRCHRERGIWRAKRFWPPENVPVRADELADGDLEALEAEPLLSVSPVLEV